MARFEVRRGSAVTVVMLASLLSVSAQSAWSQADTTPPETTITEGPADGSTINTDAPFFGWASSEANSTFTCIAGGVKLSSCEQAFVTGAPNGRHSFSVAATDPAGNTDQTPATRSFTVDLGGAPSSSTRCQLDGNEIFGTNARDTRNGTAGTDVMFGLRGNDVLRGGAGADCVSGQAGNDRLFGGRGADVLDGGTGNDHLSDSSGRDRFSGGSGSDRIEARDQFDRRVADDVRCGPGRYDIAIVDAADRVARDCERVRRRAN